MIPTAPSGNTGCPLDDTGWSIVVEAFYNDDENARLYGTDNYGDGVYGDINGAGAPGWVDLTTSSISVDIIGGSDNGALPVPVGSLAVQLKDLDAEVVDFVAPASYFDPEAGTPIRVGLLDGGSTWYPLFTGRIELAQDPHSSRVRVVSIEALDGLTELVATIPDWTAPAEDTTARVSRVLAELNQWEWGTSLADSIDLLSDDDVAAITARQLIDTAAWSSGLDVYCDPNNVLTFSEYPAGYDDTAPVVVTDCLGQGDVAATEIVLAKDTAAVLNRVELFHRNRSGFTSGVPATGGGRVPPQRGPQGETGPAGPQGEMGPAGPTGPAPPGGAEGEVLHKVGPNDGLVGWRWAPHWRSAWVQGEYYAPFAMVRDGRWLMICTNQAGTYDRPAPQPTGDELEVYQGASTNTETSTADSVFAGVAYTTTNGVFVTGVRVYEIAGEDWALYAYNATDGLTEIFGRRTAPSTGWLRLDIGTVTVPAGVEFAMLVQRWGVPNYANTFSGDWDVIYNNGNPGLGDLYVRNSQNVIRVNHVDNNLGDRQTELESVPVGGIVEIGGTDYTVVSVTLSGAYTEYLVGASVVETPGVQSVTFKWGNINTVARFEDAGVWSADPEVSGLFSETGPPLTADDNQYGVDLYVRAAIVSADWELMALGDLAVGGT